MRSTPRIVAHLIAINLIFFVGTQFSSELSNDVMSLHYFKNDKFIISQILTHMFMHGSVGHILFNMIALWMFGSTLVILLLGDYAKEAIHVFRKRGLFRGTARLMSKFQMRS